MDLNVILLICAALLPAIALCVYVFKKDRVEKEPLGLLLGLFFAGVLICFPAAELETVLFSVIDAIFSNFATEVDGTLYLSGIAYKIYNACQYFIGVALVEEGLKFAVLLLITRKSKQFNSLFDGIIYAVFVSLGFAAFENVLYVLENGWVNAAMRAVTAVPGHMCFAVLMGYYYSMWHMLEKAKQQERELKRSGVLDINAPEFSGRSQLALSLFVPVMAHGWYDYCCTAGTILSLIALIVFIVVLYLYCFAHIKDMSRNDMPDSTYSSILVFKKYPKLYELIVTLQDAAKQNETENK